MHVFFLLVSKMSTLKYNWASSFVSKKAQINNILHNIINLRDTEVAMCIIPALHMY